MTGTSGARSQLVGAAPADGEALVQRGCVHLAEALG